MPADFPTARSLSNDYALGCAHPVSVTECALERATSVPEAFIVLTPERAHAEAAQSAARWKSGAPLSPLDGVPVAWKDLFDIAGRPRSTRSTSPRTPTLGSSPTPPAPALSASAKPTSPSSPFPASASTRTSARR
jgi:aspartyl-tRNA(Asn)/glutamyl-tRNA(Gln) amidotransferase subunit A